MESLYGTGRTTVNLAPPFLIAHLHSLSSTLTSQNLKKISLNYKLTKHYEDKRVAFFPTAITSSSYTDAHQATYSSNWEKEKRNENNKPSLSRAINFG